ncbi:MAG: EAL domain-containing protein [Gemmatimonadaceae bacterium]|nr:EAL domain-containing protein [Gemmatimonadaceae bacterium]
MALSSLLEWPSPEARATLLNVAYLVIGLPTMAALIGAARFTDLDAESRRAWRVMSFAIGAVWLGDVIWAAIALATGERPPLSVADAAYVAFVPLAFWSLVSFPGLGPTRAERIRVQLDAAIAAITAATVVSWLSPVREETENLATWLGAALNVSYPLVDIMLVSVLLVLLWRQTQREHMASFRLLILGFGVKTIADVLYAHHVLTAGSALSSVADVCWLGWYGFVTLSAHRAREYAQDDATKLERIPRHTGWLAYACVSAAGLLLLVLVQLGDLDAVRGVAIGVFSLLAVVLIRQSIVVSENARLDSVAAERAAESRMAALVHHASDLIVVVDTDGTTRYVSPSVEHIMGVQEDTLMGKCILNFIHEDDLEEARLLLGRLSRQADEQTEFVCRAARTDGEWRWLEVVGTNQLHTPSISGLVLNARDVTDRRELESKIAWQAFHDPMTSLANRVLFSDRVTHALARRARGPVEIGVLFIDLDHFKNVNDSLGHAAGDELLRQAARRIECEVRAADTVARLGGDEFAVLIEDSPIDSCLNTAHRLLAQLTRPFMIDGREVFVGASIGVAEALPGVNLESLIRDADVAMYVAKHEGRARVVRFQPSMRDGITDRLLLEADLRRAVERDELSIHYQPLVDLQSGEILGAEALLRWHHPTRGLITPSIFVPIAEDVGIMSQISRQVLMTACRDAMVWRAKDADGPTLHVSVNLSGRHMQEASVVDDVRAALASTGMEASRLTIEMTETAMMSNADAVIATMRALKDLGVTLALDDFGTGYSSLSHLQRFPIDVLKIDRTFITQLGGAATNDALTRAILSLGETMGLVMIAEGIENERQLAALQELGCMLGQGFLMSPPMGGPEFARLVASGEPLYHAAHVPGLIREASLLGW